VNYLLPHARAKSFVAKPKAETIAVTKDTLNGHEISRRSAACNHFTWGITVCGFKSGS
jgi:hypothetical protein